MMVARQEKNWEVKLAILVPGDNIFILMAIVAAYALHKTLNYYAILFLRILIPPIEEVIMCPRVS